MLRELLKKIKVPGLFVIATFILAAIVDLFNFNLGEFVNNFFPCEQVSMSSIPCYAIWDVLLKGVLSLVFIISQIISLLIILKYIIKNKKQKRGSTWPLKMFYLAVGLYLIWIISILMPHNLPSEEHRNIIGEPQKHLRGTSKPTITFGDRYYYYEYRGDLYYHQVESMSVSGRVSASSDIKIENGDPATFKIIDSNFAKDKNQVYYWGSIVEKADPETFQTLDWPKAKDKNYYFSQSKITGEVE